MDVDEGAPATARLGKSKVIDSPPLPPVKKGNGSSSNSDKALRIRPPGRGTFLDDKSPINNDADEYHQSSSRDSHDLSISPQQVTRDSLVDNMLLSLDQFSHAAQPNVGSYGSQQIPRDESQRYPPFIDDAPGQYGSGRNGRVLMHRASYSSDYDNITEDASRFSSRGRRSNSSSSFRTALPRISSIRNSDYAAGAQQVANGRSGAVHSRSRKGSKGSSADSLDLGYSQITGTQRSAHGLGTRSSSFDYGHESHRGTSQSNSVLRHQAQGPSFSSFDYEAAPTPTVPVGPRRQQPLTPNPSIYREPLPLSPNKRPLERKRSNRSSKNAYKNRNDIVGGGRVNHGLQDTSRSLPPLPAFKEQAHAPHIGYGKQKENNNTSTPSKERPGFFRRVFGTSKNTIAHSLDVAPAPPRLATPTETVDRPVAKQHIVDLMKATPPPPVGERPHVITKKSSSFFRRRKRSVTELEQKPPPLPIDKHYQQRLFIEESNGGRANDGPQSVAPPLQLDPNDDRQETCTSPVSSLRQVMNPYLRSPPTSPLRTNTHTDTLNRQLTGQAGMQRSTRGFSPDYMPDQNATIRAVRTESRQGSSGTLASQGKMTIYDIERGAPQRRPQDNLAPDTKDSTFLQDSSDTDRDNGISKNKASVPEESSLAARQNLRHPMFNDDEHSQSNRSPYANRLQNKDGGNGFYSTNESDIGDRATVKNGAAFDNGIRSMGLKSAKENGMWNEPASSEEDLGASALNLPLEGVKVTDTANESQSTIYRSTTSLPVVQIDFADENMTGSEAYPLSAPPATGNEIEGLDILAITDANSREITEGDRSRARGIYEGEETFISKAKAAGWLGDEGLTHRRTLAAYMDLFDLTNLNILASLRHLCGRLILRAESQQVDRILDEFSKRWCQCNRDHGFKNADVVHTICYSILLLNTDLHLADIEQKMTRSQFVKNTMPTIRRVLADTAPAANFEYNRPSILPAKKSSQTQDLPTLNTKLSSGGGDDRVADPRDRDGSRNSVDLERPACVSPPSSSKLPAQVFADPSSAQPSSSQAPTPLDYERSEDDCGPLVRTPFHGTLRTWEVQVEVVLKDFYGSIRAERLPLFGADSSTLLLQQQQQQQQLLLQQQPSQSALSVITNSFLRRTPSVLSKTPSDGMSVAATYQQGRAHTADGTRSHHHLGTGKWTARNWSRPRLYPGSTMGSSRTSLDDQQSIWSPSGTSSVWTRYSLGKTQTSMSAESLGSDWQEHEPSSSSTSSRQQSQHQQSIGFASALSHAIIREDALSSALGLGLGGGGGEEQQQLQQLRAAPLLEDETLELAGAPWAKEGIVKHRQNVGAAGAKKKLKDYHKDHSWAESFAVIERGLLTLFSFSGKGPRGGKGSSCHHHGGGGGSGGSGSSSYGSFGIAGGSGGGGGGGGNTMVVGGGNWQENAEQLGTFVLRQTIASALPPPGYSKARPHVWALSLPTGAVHLFQVGTPEIVREFVTTANYWSARLSNHPLVGGISNIEYGWSDGVVNHESVLGGGIGAAGAAFGGAAGARPSTGGQRPSMQGSIRSRTSVDHHYHRGGGGGTRSTRLPGDKVVISEWSFPTQNLRASNLMERDQKATLEDYVKGIEEELEKHNGLRSAMTLAFTPRHPNAQKAMNNWEKKSSYLLKELIKFQTYIDALQAADEVKQALYKEREERIPSVSGAAEAAAAAAAAAGKAPAAAAADDDDELDADATLRP